MKLLILLGALLLVMAGCASEPKASPSATPVMPQEDAPVSPSTEPKTPFMFNEAALPDGFSKPGPVGKVIIKKYPAYRAARTDASAGGGESRMFRTLFDHIKSQKIAMTAPVEMTYAPEAAATRPVKPESMLFMYRTPTTGTPGHAGNVEVVDFPAMTVISMTHRGSYGSGYSACMPKLLEWLKEHDSQYQVVGPPRFLGYNSPFVPWFLQIGEMQIPVRPK